MILPVGRTIVAKANQPAWRTIDVLWVHHMSPGVYLIFNVGETDPKGLHMNRGKEDRLWGDAYYELVEEA